MSQQISLAQAVEMTTLYRNKREEILKPLYRTDILPICETFEKADIQSILDQSECVSFRLYYGMDDKDLIHAIFVGVDAEGRDILPPSGTGNTSTGGDEGILIDDGHRCPHTCPPASPLNP